MIFDVGFGLLVLSALFRGYRRAFLGQVVMLAGIILGIMFAGNLVDAFGEKLEPHLSRVPVDLRPATLHFAGVLAITLLVWLIGGILFSQNRTRFVGEGGPSLFDRTAGGLLAGATAVVVVCLIVEGIGHLPKQIREQEWVETQMAQSRGVEWAKETPVAPWLLDVPEVQVALHHAETLIDKVHAKKGSLPESVDDLQKMTQDLVLPAH